MVQLILGTINIHANYVSVLEFFVSSWEEVPFFLMSTALVFFLKLTAEPTTEVTWGHWGCLSVR